MAQDKQSTQKRAPAQRRSKRRDTKATTPPSTNDRDVTKANASAGSAASREPRPIKEKRAAASPNHPHRKSAVAASPKTKPPRQRHPLPRLRVYRQRLATAPLLQKRLTPKPRTTQRPRRASLARCSALSKARQEPPHQSSVALWAGKPIQHAPP